MNDVDHDELVARMDYLQRRYQAKRDKTATGGWWHRWTGVSSDALVDVGLGWSDITHERPSDLGDLLACEISYDQATPAMRERMAPLLDGWRTDVLADHQPTGLTYGFIAVGVGWLEEPAAAPTTIRQLHEPEVAFQRSTPAMQERMLPFLLTWRGALTPGFNPSTAHEALVAVGFGWDDEPRRSAVTAEQLSLCERTYDRCYPAMQERMLPFLDAWREQIDPTEAAS